MTAVDLEHLRNWIGRSETAEDRLDARRAAQMAGTIGFATVPGEGDPLPLPWHWLYCTPIPLAGQTGVDGHPARGGFLPPVPLPRRMWAGSDVNCRVPLRIGDSVRRVSTIAAVEAKRGRAGQLLFVTVDHAVYGGDGDLALEERQHIVYREPAAAARENAAERGHADPPQQWVTTVTPDPVLLFRYSALTFNGHRIHYDRDYAVGEEGYPDLVVHGPLTASLLLGLAYDRLGDVAIGGFSFRARRPLFAGAVLTLCGGRDGEQLTLCALTPENDEALRLDARLAAV